MPKNYTSATGHGVMNTTNVSAVDPSSSEEENDSPSEVEGHDESDNLIMIDIVVPLVITSLIVVLLCLAVLYTKARRKRNAQAGRSNDHLPSISGGVPLNAAAFQNYSAQVIMRDQSRRTTTARPDSGASFSSDSVSMYLDRPPSYEDVIKETNSRASTLGSQGTICSDTGRHSMVIAPPPYTRLASPKTRGSARVTQQTGTLSATSDTLTADSGISSRTHSHQSGNFTEIPLTDPNPYQNAVSPAVSESALSSPRPSSQGTETCAQNIPAYSSSLPADSGAFH